LLCRIQKTSTRLARGDITSAVFKTILRYQHVTPDGESEALFTVEDDERVVLNKELAPALIAGRTPVIGLVSLTGWAVRQQAGDVALVQHCYLCLCIQKGGRRATFLDGPAPREEEEE